MSTTPAAAACCDWRSTTARKTELNRFPANIKKPKFHDNCVLVASSYHLFIYLIIEAKQSNTISKNHNKQVIIVSAAKDDEGLLIL